MDTFKINAKGTKMIAHRGVSALECENTGAAFIAAGSRSYYGIETDIRPSKDGRLVIYHDDEFTRLTGLNRLVSDCTLEEIKSISLRDPHDGQSRRDLVVAMPEDYIRICKKYNKRAVLELKSYLKNEHLQPIVDLITDLDYMHNVIFISFVWDYLVALREMLPKQKIQFLTGTYSDKLPKQLKEYNIDLDIEYHALNEDLVKMLHDQGTEVNCWTCDDAEDAERLIEWQVDYITSDILE